MSLDCPNPLFRKEDGAAFLEAKFQKAIASLTDAELCLPAGKIATLIIQNTGGRKRIAECYRSRCDFDESDIELPALLDDRFERCKPTFFLQYLDSKLSPNPDTSFTPRQLITATLSLQIADAFEKRVWPAEESLKKKKGKAIATIAKGTRRDVSHVACDGDSSSLRRPWGIEYSGSVRRHRW